ncbi:ribonuclease H-like protein [Dacryopinax primogenitus]|uniref:Ribonuclease H-like protein n=1 Tax=Dacryopinax primogenitus (strain DJM 731) TaxID=1858805 RepID=M5FP24_DACPD|nr:ribonuclease H-like protein [Dacryopinax primogenitus]EJT96738.1 ribonuclease H-like protein [Dacryopinax primogenitus]
MTGLDWTRDQILEIAMVVTNGNLDIVHDGFREVVRTEKSVLDRMGEWCTTHHTRSGLVDQCLSSSFPLQEIESLALSYLKHWVPYQGSAVLGGSSVHVDRAFLQMGMPRLCAWLHYRIVDVSSIKELCKRWYPQISTSANLDRKQPSHRALADIQGSISELKFYRQLIFRDPAEVRAPDGSL